jgi:type IV secretory pathway VirB3-like protein
MLRVIGTSGYLIALIASDSPYVIALLLAAWVFVAGYSRSSKVWGGLSLIITISVRAFWLAFAAHLSCS